ncbi:MAG: sensor domain-containing diguanylate cyclase [Panacagrimonas sp.]
MSESHYLKEELYARVASDPQIFEFLQNSSLDGLWYWDLENPEHEWMNPKLWEVLGYDPKARKHLASEWQDLINADDLKLALENFHAHCADPGHPYDQIVRYRHASGKTVWVRCRGVAIRDAAGKPVRMLGAHNDITEMKELEEKLRHMAYSDVLTGLASRRALEEHVEWSVGGAKRANEILSLVFIDIDHFKRINDSYDHQTGDAVLIAVGKGLKQVCRDSDFSARFGGDEFVVLAHGADLEGSTMLAERIREKIISLDVIERKISASIGISTLVPSAVASQKDVIKRFFRVADHAVYAAKAAGRNQVIHGGYVDAEQKKSIGGAAL